MNLQVWSEIAHIARRNYVLILFICSFVIIVGYLTMVSYLMAEQGKFVVITLKKIDHQGYLEILERNILASWFDARSVLLWEDYYSSCSHIYCAIESCTICDDGDSWFEENTALMMAKLYPLFREMRSCVFQRCFPSSGDLLQWLCWSRFLYFLRCIFFLFKNLLLWYIVM